MDYVKLTDTDTFHSETVGRPTEFPLGNGTCCQAVICGCWAETAATVCVRDFNKMSVLCFAPFALVRKQSQYSTRLQDGPLHTLKQR